MNEGEERGITCLSRYLLVFWLVLFLLLCAGTSSAETITSPYVELQSKYQSLTNELNRLVILSQSDMMKLQAQLPGLIVEVQELNQKAIQLESQVEILQAEAKGLRTELTTLESQLTELKTEIEKLSASLKNSVKLTKLFTEQLDVMKRRTNTGLVIAIVSGILGLLLIGYEVFNGT